MHLFVGTPIPQINHVSCCTPSIILRARVLAVNLNSHPKEIVSIALSNFLHCIVLHELFIYIGLFCGTQGKEIISIDVETGQLLRSIGKAHR